MKPIYSLLRRFNPGWLHALTLLLLTGFSSQQARASHMAGADLTYTHVSGNQYRVIYTLYRDCSGIPAPPDLNVSLQSVSCNQYYSYTLTKMSGTGTEITFPCSGSYTACSGGVAPGIQEWKYEAVIGIPQACPDWVLSVVNCCRNSAISTLSDPGTENIYLEARLNNEHGPNNSPLFTNSPIVFLCLDQGTVLNNGVTEADGDSLVYSLISPETGPTTHVNYLPPFSGTNPLSSSPAVTINPVTGDINMHPLQIQVSVMAIRVEEYRHGVLAGSVLRDIQVYVQNCTNTLPTLSGINGGNSYTSVACPGSPVCFDIFSNDADPGQQLSLTTNLSIPGAAFTVSGGAHPAGHFCWTPGPADARNQPYVFTVTVKDNACPSNAVQTYSYSLYVPPFSATVTTTSVSCQGMHDGSARVAVNAGTAPYIYSWAPYGGNGPEANFLSGGTYSATVTDANGCSLVAQAYVTEGQPVTINATIEHATCHSANGSARVEVAGGTLPYRYEWFPWGGTESSAAHLTAGSYSVTVTDANGCSAFLPVIINGSQLQIQLVNLEEAVCENGDDGSATVFVPNGEPPFHYSWYPFGGNAPTAEHLTPGMYTITISDKENCSSFMNVRVGFKHFLPLVSFHPEMTGCKGQTLTLDAGSGYANYIWSTNSTDQRIEVTRPDTLSVLVTDHYGCQSVAEVRVNFVTCTGITGKQDDDVVYIYPNPTVDMTNISMTNPDHAPITVYLNDMLGQVVWSRHLEDTPALNEKIDMQNLAAGMFFLTVQRGDRRYSGKIIKE